MSMFYYELQKAKEANFFNFDDFDYEEYEHYEKVQVNFNSMAWTSTGIIPEGEIILGFSKNFHKTLKRPPTTKFFEILRGQVTPLTPCRCTCFIPICSAFNDPWPQSLFKLFCSLHCCKSQLFPKRK